MERIIFYSWQSDLPNSTNRGFIQRALEKAAKGIAADNTVEHVPVIDRDTLGIPGAPHIAVTILDKIAAADVVVADVSIVAGRESQRPTPNPNVLIELGYALCSRGQSRIVLVLNTAYGGPEELPFDLKMYRVMTYCMPPSDSDTDRADERASLQARLDAAIRAALAVPRPNPPAVPSKAEALISELTDPHSKFFVSEPASVVPSVQYYRFVCAPHDESAARRLTGKVEEEFRQSIAQAFGIPPPQGPPSRSSLLSAFRGQGYLNSEQLIALTAKGALGFTTLACTRTTDGILFFVPTEFLFNLACFLGCAALFYRKAGYRAGCLLNVALAIPQKANVFANSTRRVQVPGTNLFNNPLLGVMADVVLAEKVDMNGMTGETILNILDSVMLNVARQCGQVLSNNFRADVAPITDDVIKRITDS